MCGYEAAEYAADNTPCWLTCSLGQILQLAGSLGVAASTSARWVLVVVTVHSWLS